MSVELKAVTGISSNSSNNKNDSIDKDIELGEITNGGYEPDDSNTGKDNSSSVVMRNTILPTTNKPVTTEDGEIDAVSDDSDGYDALNAKNLQPLLSGNQYTVRKMASQALMDVALMMANISQLRTLLTIGPDAMDSYYFLVVLVGLSLAFQIFFAILMFIIWMRESDQDQKEEYLNTLSQVAAATNEDGKIRASKQIRMTLMKKEEEYKTHRTTMHLNYVTIVMVFFITVINMFITGFGIKLDTQTNSSISTGGTSG